MQHIQYSKIHGIFNLLPTYIFNLSWNYERLWVPAIYIANDPHAQLINNKDDMSKHVLGNDFNRKKLFLSPLKVSMSHMKWRWEIEIRTNREDEEKTATLKPKCMKTLILYILFSL